MFFSGGAGEGRSQQKSGGQMAAAHLAKTLKVASPTCLDSLAATSTSGDSDAKQAEPQERQRARLRYYEGQLS